jgi:anti-sigma-K factor RskA
MSHPEQESPLDLAAAYALGALAPDEVQRFEAFLATSPEAQREVAEFRDVAALLALAGVDAAPGAELRQRVLARVEAEKDMALGPAKGVGRGAGGSGARSSGLIWGALAASLVAAVGLGVGYVDLRNQVGELRSEIASRELILARTRQQLIERDATLRAILEPGVQLFQLTASGDPEPGIQLFWDQRRNQAIIHGFRLRPVPPGRAYQLWFIQDGKPVPSVTFKPETTGNAKVEQVPVPTGGTISAAAVTVEPESGSPQPTSPILLVGSLQKKS